MVILVQDRSLLRMALSRVLRVYLSLYKYTYIYIYIHLSLCVGVSIYNAKALGFHDHFRVTTDP